MKKVKLSNQIINSAFFSLLIICLVIIFLPQDGEAKIKEGGEKTQLVVKTIKMWPEIDRSEFSSVVDELEPIGFWLEVSWPMDWDEGNIQFLLQGKPVPFKEGGGGFGEGFYDRDYFIYAGAPGSKYIEVVFSSDKKKAGEKVKVNFRSRGGFVPLNRVNNELFTASEQLEFLSWFFKDYKVEVNGREQKLEDLEIFDGIHLLRCRPEFKPGINQIHFSGFNYDNERKEWEFRIFYRQAGELEIGDSFALKYECFETKSESINLEIEGKAVVAAGEGKRNYIIFKLDNNFINYEGVCLQPLMAREKGESIIKIIKSHWRGEEELLKEIKLKVK